MSTQREIRRDKIASCFWSAVRCRRWTPVPVTTFLKVAWRHDMISVARAPLALLETDDLAAWTLRRPSAKQCSDRATTPAWGRPWKSVA